MSVLGPLLFRPSPIPFPLIPSVSHSTTTTTAPKSFSRNNNSTLSLVHHKRRHSKSYLERQSAILELQQTSQSHLDSALARYFTHIIFLSFMCVSYLKLSVFFFLHFFCVCFMTSNFFLLIS